MYTYYIKSMIETHIQVERRLRLVLPVRYHSRYSLQPARGIARRSGLYLRDCHFQLLELPGSCCQAIIATVANLNLV